MSHTLILLRHGQSTWNLENLFTGWTDVGLTDHGREEAISAGKLLAAEGLTPTNLHTSVLKRAIQTAEVTLDAMDLSWIPVQRSWRLNERHYGRCRGLTKSKPRRSTVPSKCCNGAVLTTSRRRRWTQPTRDTLATTPGIPIWPRT